MLLLLLRGPLVVGDVPASAGTAVVRPLTEATGAVRTG